MTSIKLSYFLNLEVVTEKGGCLIFTKNYGSSGGGKKIHITKKGTTKLIDLIPEVTKAISDGNRINKTLLDRSVYLSYEPTKKLFPLKLDCYTHSASLIPNRGFGFEDDEWTTFVNQKDTICKLLRLKDTRKKRRDANGIRRVNITLYKWKWMTDNNVVEHNSEGFFSKEHCKANAMMAIHGNSGQSSSSSSSSGSKCDSLKLVIETFSSLPPSPSLLMQYCFIHVLDETINKIMYGEGKTKQRSYNQYINGHAQDRQEVIHTYIGMARQSSHTETLVTLYDRITELYDLERIDSKLLAEACQFYMSTVLTLFYLTNPPQFRSIQMVVRDTYNKYFIK
jgi:hypothetical protein